MGYERISVTPLTGGLGAEIVGIDLGRPLDNQQFAEVHGAFLDHLVIFFRDQELTPDQHKDFSFRFGPPAEVKFIDTLPDHPEILEIVREPSDAGSPNFGGRWHSDFSFYEQPPLGSALYAREVPPYGGDTMWVNMAAAYEALSDGMKRLLDDLTALHSGARSYGSGGRFTSLKPTSMNIRNTEEGDLEIEHPVVRTHPETGRKCLFVNPVYTMRFADMTEAESQPLLEFLYKHALQPEFTCRFRWSKGALALWDNRNTMHIAINDYHGGRRVMHRTTIAGDRPY